MWVHILEISKNQGSLRESYNRLFATKIMNPEYYEQAQTAIAMLKGAICALLADPDSPPYGMRNSEIGRALGIYATNVGKGHTGHVSRTLLKMMELEEVVQYDEKSNFWQLYRK